MLHYLPHDFWVILWNQIYPTEQDSFKIWNLRLNTWVRITKIGTWGLTPLRLDLLKSCQLHAWNMEYLIRTWFQIKKKNFDVTQLWKVSLMVSILTWGSSNLLAICLKLVLDFTKVLLTGIEDHLHIWKEWFKAFCGSPGSCVKSGKLPQVMSHESASVASEDYKFENLQVRN